MSRVVVVGAGLAGLTAALRCADAGDQVTVLESAPRLGGLTTSYLHGDLMVDNGQHVFLRCCTSYRALLERLGVSDQVHLQSRLDVAVLEPGGRAHRLHRSNLPAPLHLTSTLFRYRALTLRQRLSVVRAVLALGRVRIDDPATDEISFGSWLGRHGQDARTIAALWDLVGVATLNAPADEASLALAATVFQIGLLSDRGAGDIGWAKVPLQQLHGDAAQRALEALGATVRCSARVESLQPTDKGWRVALRERDDLEADCVILATAPPAAEALLPPGALDALPGWAEQLGANPIVNVHVRYDRRVLDESFAAGLGSPVQWVFDRSAQVGLTQGQYIAVSLSAAQDLVDLTVAQIREFIEPALAELLPRAQDAVVQDFFVTRERAATFRPTPGSRALRPGPQTAMPGLFVAGAWTDTGWPATMEGAVRSGDAAADALGSWSSIPDREPAGVIG